MGRDPSFLLLTYDSCRYDVLSRADTPNLDSRGQIYRAQTPGNFTYPAHQAFFSGHLPLVEEPVPYLNRFHGQLFTLQRLTVGGGRRSLASTASTWNVPAGLGERGYQTVGAGAMNWFRQASLTAGFEVFKFTGTDADQQIDFLLQNLDSERPFFGFINFGETHSPFTYAGKPAPDLWPMSSDAMQWPSREEGAVGEATPHFAHQVEAAEFLDSRLPRLFDSLPGPTVVVLCADHGECFGEDGYWGHGVNHPRVLEVPMAIFRLDGQPLPRPRSALSLRDRAYMIRPRLLRRNP